MFRTSGPVEDLLKQKLLTEEFADLFEDAVNQATRAMSDDRIEYIASLLKNGLSSDDLTHLDNKKLSAILGELNDAEILILKFHTLMGNRQREFAEQHGSIFAVQPATMGSGRDVIDRETIRATYYQNLTRLRLLMPRYQRVRKGEVPEFDERTGTVKSTGYETTSLGRLLLRRLDIAESDW